MTMSISLSHHCLLCRSEPRFTSTLRIGCCRPSSGAQQAPARESGGTRGKMYSASSFLPDLLHFSNWFSAPSSLLLCLARACCVPELGRQQPILSVDVNLGQDRTEPNRPTHRGRDRESGTALTSFFRLPRRRRSRRFAPN